VSANSHRVHPTSSLEVSVSGSVWFCRKVAQLEATTHR